VSYVDASDVQKVSDAIIDNTKLVFLETPANSALKLNDREAISKLTKAINIPLVIDNTFSYILQPLIIFLGLFMKDIKRKIIEHFSFINISLDQ
jgi:cystathionine beta-lyase/cystathionine gamma-synthase